MLLFIDESGHDHGNAPYEVLAGVAIRERDLWNLIQAVRGAELEFFGVHLSEIGAEMKGKRLLKKKNFRFATQEPALAELERREATRSFLEKGRAEELGGPRQARSRREFTAYGQAALAFVERVFALMGRYRVKIFAALVSTEAARSANNDMLRRDYSFLFERFFYYLEDSSPSEMGLVVFDELEKAQCRVLLHQMEHYFLDTARGYQRSSRIVPEPFFVHSDLTTAVQLADLVAYCLNWGVRLNRMTAPVRDEIVPLAEQAFGLRYVGERPDQISQRVWPIYGVFYVEDLRPRKERAEGEPDSP